MTEKKTKAPARGKKAATAQPGGEGRGRKGRSAPALTAQLTDARREYEEKLKACLPQERKFIKYKLDGCNNTVAAKRAGYSEKTAEEQGAQILGRLRVKEAMQAGWAVLGFGPDEVLGGIREMVEFDASEVMSYVHEVVQDVIERPAAEVLDELREEIQATRMFLEDMRAEEAPEEEMRPIASSIRKLRKRELDLVVLLGRDEQATVLEVVERRKRVPYVDLEKVQESGKTKFITGIKNTPHGRNIEMISRKDVLDMAGRAHGVFKDRKVLENPDGSPVNAGGATVIVLPGNGREDR